MGDAAVVIGINRYWKPGACLRAAVPDALRMREWLVSPEGGAVPKENVFLLLALRDADPKPDVPYIEATQANLLRTIQADLAKTVGTAGRRFYFHYSGHGVNARVNFADVSAMLACDFDDVVTTNSISYASILDFFKATQFEEQFFFFDACRDTPWAHEFVIGQLSRPRKIDPKLPAVQQYVCFATTPQLQAVEIQDVGDEHGAFTGALLDGLAGTGAAKVWDADAGQYLVRWDNLYRQVKAAVEARKHAVGEGGKRIQVPQSSGDNFSKNPVLASIPADRVASSKMKIEVSGGVAPVRVAVVDNGDFDAEREADDKGTVELELKPREYAVSARAKGFISSPKRKRIDLYDAHASVSVQLVEVLSGDEASGQRGFDDFSPAVITVRSSDPVARLELVDSAGAVVASGLGIIDNQEVPKRFYTAQLRSPEGSHREEQVYADEGLTEILLGAPEPPASDVARAIIGEAGFWIRDDNTLDISEHDRNVASAQLSTLLTVAAHVVNKDVPLPVTAREPS